MSDNGTIRYVGGVDVVSNGINCNVTSTTATTTATSAFSMMDGGLVAAGVGGGGGNQHIQELALAGLLSVVIVVTVIGNTLVILAVLTTRRLRTVTNCFVMSLAVADWLVGIFVMPPAVAYRLMGEWELGWILCDIWVSLDVLLCTASILSLCAISVDRYLAVTQPLSYSRKRRSKRLAFSMILVVWISSALITCPPMFGWYEHGRHTGKTCRYNKNTGYVIFSAMGSFFIPMVVMLYVYVRISCVVAQRHDQLSNIEGRSQKSQKLVLSSSKEDEDEEVELERASSECDDHHKLQRQREEENEEKVVCTRYFSSGGEDETVVAANHHVAVELRRKPIVDRRHCRSLRSTLSYSFKSDPRTSSLYMTTTTTTTTKTLSTNQPKQESIHRDIHSVLNYEPASRVASFRRETKTAQTLSIVVGGFVACWLPFFIYYLLTPFLPSSPTTSVVMGYLTWLGWINSAINPFIYAFYSPDFRIAFWRLTFRHFSKTRRADVNAAATAASTAAAAATAFQHK